MLEDEITAANSEKRLRGRRRLSEMILVAFHQACDQADLEVAEQLIKILEMVLHRPTHHPERRRKETFVGAYTRLWHLHHTRQGQAESREGYHHALQVGEKWLEEKKQTE